MRKSALQAVLERIQRTLHATRRTPHGASPLAQAVSRKVIENPTCSVPALWGCDGLQYGHTATAMHEIEYIPPIEYPPPLKDDQSALILDAKAKIAALCSSWYAPSSTE